MPGYLDSPLYQQMLARTLSQGQPQSQYPGQAIANTFAQLLNTYQMKQAVEGQKAEETAGNQQLAKLLAPEQFTGSGYGAPDMKTLSGGLQIDAAAPQLTDQNADKRSGLAALLNTGALSRQDLGPQIAQQLGFGAPKAPIKLGKDEGLYDPTTFQPIVKPKGSPVSLGRDSRLVNPDDGSQVVGIAPPDADPNKPFDPVTGNAQQGYQDYEKGLRVAGRPTTNVNVSTERGYAGAMAGKLAEQDAAALDAARTAPQRIQSAQNVLKILDTQKPITGTGADARLFLDKALSTAGLVDGKNVTSTENLVSELASQTLDAIKTSGLGSGQGFTDKDRQFLMDAKAGRIEINAGTLRYLAQKNEAAARASLQRGNAIARRLQGDPTFGSVGQNLETEEPAPYAPQQAAGPGAAPGTPRVLRYNPQTRRLE